MWLRKRKSIYDSVHSYGCGQAHLGMPKVITNFKPAVCKDKQIVIINK